MYAYGAAGRLALLSKARRHEPLGEFVGISRLTARLPSAICRHHETGGEAAAAHQYDDCLSDLSATHRIGLHCVDDLVWGEIDDPAQHRRAVSYVLPALSGSPATRARPA